MVYTIRAEQRNIPAKLRLVIATRKRFLAKFRLWIAYKPPNIVAATTNFYSVQWYDKLIKHHVVHRYKMTRLIKGMFCFVNQYYMLRGPDVTYLSHTGPPSWLFNMVKIVLPYIYILFGHLGIQTDSNWKYILQTHCCEWQSIRNAHWIQVYKKPKVQWNSNHYLLSRINAHLRFNIRYVRALLFHMVLSLITFDFGSD